MEEVRRRVLITITRRIMKQALDERNVKFISQKCRVQVGISGACFLTVWRDFDFITLDLSDLD
jgi:hypothetical protein